MYVGRQTTETFQANIRKIEMNVIRFYPFDFLLLNGQYVSPIIRRVRVEPLSEAQKMFFLLNELDESLHIACGRNILKIIFKSPST